MDFDAFKELLLQVLQERAGKEWKVTAQAIEKNNGIRMEAITVMRKGGSIAPAVYLEDFYQWYRTGAGIEEIAETVFQLGKERALKEEWQTVNLQDYGKVRSHICYKLVNYKMNRNYLKQVPYFSYLDLAIVFYYRIEEDPLEGAAFLIHSSNLEEWGITKKQLYEDAHKNTCRKLPYRFQGMEELIREMMGEVPFSSPGSKEHMYVLTNEEKYFGAAALLYPHILLHLSTLVGGNYYVLPSSIHECILVPDSGQYSQDELSNMVKEVNETQVEEEEILSGQVYYFDAKKNELMI